MTKTGVFTGELEPAFETQAINTIRMLSADGVQAAKSGHPGMPMGMAPAAFTLWMRYMRYSPTNPNWANRDRFILSAGHGSMLLYSLLHLTGYALPLEELKNFRQWHSMTAGHPEYGYAPGIETTTGPLGQGFANGVGFAIAERWLAERYNRPGFDIVDHYTYAIVSDGELMEGVASEAASLAGHLQLGKIIYLYDDNNITIDGAADVSYSEDWAQRFEAYNWHVQKIDGMNPAEVAKAIEAAQNDPRPSLIGCKTTIGFGSPNLAGTSKVHGAALGVDELKLTKENLGWPLEPSFYIAEDVQDFYHLAMDAGRNWEARAEELFQEYSQQYPDEAAEYKAIMAGDLPAGWADVIPSFVDKADATRNTSGKVINALATALPNLVGGSADLAESNKTTISGKPFINAGDFKGPNIHFGVREHGMGSILNGMALHGGLIPYGATFLIFSDYMRPAIRLAALMGIRVIYVFTHDSIGLGEDGPTHQPIEHLASLRAIPNLTVIRPADGNESAEAWRLAIENKTGPTALALTRQNLPAWDRSAEGLGDVKGVAQGGYVFYDATAKSDASLDLVLIATGSEVEIAYNAARTLADEGVGVRVVSLPSWELFSAQSEEYRAEVLPVGVKKIAVEAASPFGWERWVGNDPAQGDIVAIDKYGASAPYERIYKEYGLTPENVADRARALLQR